MLMRKRRAPTHARARTTHSSSAKRSWTSACRGHRASPKTLFAPQSRNISRSGRTTFHANDENRRAQAAQQAGQMSADANILEGMGGLFKGFAQKYKAEMAAAKDAF